MAAIDAFIIGACIGSIATFCFIWFGVALVRKWYD
jgi:hypothetical protein